MPPDGEAGLPVASGIPLGCAMVYLVLYGFGFSWFFLFFGDLTVVQCLLGAATLESCIRCGLIHSNARYGSLFEAVHGCSAQITDRDFALRYRASDATPFTEQQMRAAVRGPLRLPDSRVLHTMPVSGGYALWTEDNRGLLALTEELEELREKLKDRGRLLRQEYGLERGRRKVEEQNRLYDLLRSVTQKQIDGIAALEKAYRQTPDKTEARSILAQIAVLCCFIKRRKHLALSNYRDHRISAPELRGPSGSPCRPWSCWGWPTAFIWRKVWPRRGRKPGRCMLSLKGGLAGITGGKCAHFQSPWPSSSGHNGGNVQGSVFSFPGLSWGGTRA